MAIVDLGITDTILNIANSIWDKSPTPLRALMAIFMAGMLVFVVDQGVITPFDNMAGGQIRPLLTIGGKGCDEALRPVCSPTNVSLADMGTWAVIQAADVGLQACLLPADMNSQRECSAGFRWNAPSRVVEEQGVGGMLMLWRVNKPAGACTLLGGNQSCEAACENAINSCYGPLQVSFSGPGGISSQYISFTCAEADYDAKLLAYRDSCNRGIYLLDPRIWVFVPLLLYFVFYALTYYGAMIPG